jgi:hypothetical protein
MVANHKWKLLKAAFMRRLFILFFFYVALTSWGRALAQEPQVAVLPAGHVFAPLLGDTREAQTGLLFESGLSQFDGDLGGSLDLARLTTGDGSQWAWGALGCGYLSLYRFSEGVQPFSFRLEDLDLWIGTYLSESSGYFSNRLEYLRGSSHMGDWDFFNDGLRPITYIRDGLQIIDSFQPSENFRLYGGLGCWLDAEPSVSPVYAHFGTELFTGYSHWDSDRIRGFFAYDLKVGYDQVGSVDQNFECGIQFKGPKETDTSLRLAVLYYNGDNPYGQFNNQKDNHWSLGFFVDQ